MNLCVGREKLRARNGQAGLPLAALFLYLECVSVDHLPNNLAVKRVEMFEGFGR